MDHQSNVTQVGTATEADRSSSVIVTVNNKQVKLASHRVTGLVIKEAAIAQGVAIKLDFILTLEAYHGEPARIIGDGETISVEAQSVFTANDGDDNS